MAARVWLAHARVASTKDGGPCGRRADRQRVAGVAASIAGQRFYLDARRGPNLEHGTRARNGRPGALCIQAPYSQTEASVVEGMLCSVFFFFFLRNSQQPLIGCRPCLMHTPHQHPLHR